MLKYALYYIAGILSDAHVSVSAKWSEQEITRNSLKGVAQ